MNFLAPWFVPAAAAALTIPPLVLLYFLKLKRRELPIASTLLWKRAVQDLQVNSPFQRLRNNLLLILQLLILMAGILALSEPMLAGSSDIDKAVVIMIDQSASMATDEEGQTRLELARKAALDVVEEMSTAQRASVIAFADRARVLTPLTDDKDMLRRAIESVEQTHAPGRLAEAMALAEAHSTPVGEVGQAFEVTESVYRLFTDGRLADSADVVVKRGKLDITRVGKAAENVGIVNLDVRRNYEQPERLSVLARIRNFGSTAVTRDLSLYVDGQLKDVRQVADLMPLGDSDTLARQNLNAAIPEGSDAVVPFELVLDTSARIEVRLAGGDALTVDDRAYAVAAPPRPVTLLLVTPGNRFLRDQLLPALPLSSYDVWSPEEYQQKPDEELISQGRCKYDVVVLDGHSTDRLPRGNYLFFAATPILDDVVAGQTVKGEVFLDWDDTHPVLRHVAVQAMTVFSWLDLELPPEADTLIEGTNGPVLALLERDRSQYLISAFGVFDESRQYLNTNWIFQEGFVVFMYNAVRYLAGSSTSGQVQSIQPGKPFTVSARPGLEAVTINRPDGKTETAHVRAPGVVTYGKTDRVGIYTIMPALPNEDSRAVNLLDETESWIAPNESFLIASGEVVAGTASDRINKPLWPYLLMALGGILFIEWFIYNKRVFV